MDRHIEADDAAVAEADNDDSVDPELVHQLESVTGHVVVAERTIDEVGGASVTHLLWRDHLKSSGEHRDPLLRD